MTIRAAFFTGVLAVFATSSIANAQAIRTFVASTGSDGSPCSFAFPCRSIPVAFNAVATGGDIFILDSGSFGSNVTITRSVSITAMPGASARITVATGGVGLTVNGGGDTFVSLSGLGFSGLAGGTAIRFAAGKTLSLRDLDINLNSTTLVGYGVRHTAATGHVAMSNTVIRNVQTCFIAEVPSAQQARATIVGSQGENCIDGFVAGAGAVMSAEKTTVSGVNGVCATGFVARSTGDIATLALDEIAVSGCTYGVFAGDNGQVSAASSMIAHNTIGGSVSGSGVGKTFLNNRVFRNTNNALIGFTTMASQ